MQPKAPEILNDLTHFYLDTKQFDRSIKLLGSIPENEMQAFHYELIGVAYFQAGRPLEAEAAYKKALEKEPNRVSAGIYLAAAYIQSGRLEEGQRQLDELLKKNPSNASLYGAKGKSFESQGKLEEAKQTYSQALNIDPSLTSAANNLAYILAEQEKDLEVAAKWAQTARRQEPEDPSYADTLGWVYYKTGSLVLARDQLRFAVSKEPENPVFLYHLGMIYWKNKQTDEAAQALKQTLSSNKTFKEKSLAEEGLKELAKLRSEKRGS